MCCLCIQFTHENTSERTILHLVKKQILGLVACRYDNVTLSEGYESVPFNVMEQIKMFVP